MAIVHFNNQVVVREIATASWVIQEVEVVDGTIFAKGTHTRCYMTVSLTIASLAGSGQVEVGYMVVNKEDRTRSYKGVFQMKKDFRVSEQVRKALQCL